MCWGTELDLTDAAKEIEQRGRKGCSGILDGGGPFETRDEVGTHIHLVDQAPSAHCSCQSQPCRRLTCPRVTATESSTGFQSAALTAGD